MSKKNNSFDIFISVVKAIFIKEINLRIGRYKISYIGMALEPLIPIFIFALIHSFIQHTNMNQLDYIVFLFSGFLIYSSIKNMINRGFDAISSNSGLFIYKQVKPIDAVFARIFVEMFSFLISFLVYFALGLYFLPSIIPFDISGVFLGYFLIFLFGISITIFTVAISIIFPIFKKIISFLFMPLMLFSAIFYSVGSLPVELQHYILYNPLAQMMELVHFSWLQSVYIMNIDYLYIFLWIVFPLSIGLIIYYNYSRPILMRR